MRSPSGNPFATPAVGTFGRQQSARKANEAPTKLVQNAHWHPRKTRQPAPERHHCVSLSLPSVPLAVPGESTSAGWGSSTESAPSTARMMRVFASVSFLTAWAW